MHVFSCFFFSFIFLGNFDKIDSEHDKENLMIESFLVQCQT